MNNNRKPDLHVFATSKRGNDKTFYTRIGSAWAIKSGGFSIRLDALPVNPEMVLFPPKNGDNGNGDDAGQETSQGEGAPAPSFLSRQHQAMETAR